MSSPAISVVIRAYNEAEPLARLLATLKRQDFPQDRIQLIVADNGSTDDTAAVARSYGATVVYLRQEEFNYSRSSNLGIAQAKAPIVALISAHAYPVGHRFLAAHLSWYEKDLPVAGVYGPCKPLPDASAAERRLYNPEYRAALRKGPKVKTRPRRLGTFPCISVTFRRDLWEQYPFSEAYGLGGEDTEWANYWLRKGYVLGYDPEVAYYHGHGLGWLGVARQWQYWFKTVKPRPFTRKDLGHRKDMR